MFWVGVRYRGIALPDIMPVMRVRFDNRRYQPQKFETTEQQRYGTRKPP
jgi:hypothetical protein